MIYFIPLDNESIIDLSIDAMKGRSDVTLRITENKELVKDLKKFTNKIDTVQQLSRKSIDVRVVVAFMNGRDRKEIGLDKWGDFTYDNKTYSFNHYLITLLEKNNSYIRWNKTD
jgi:hypothetical protein